MGTNIFPPIRGEGHKPSLALDLKQNGEFMVGEFDFVLGTGLKG